MWLMGISQRLSVRAILHVIILNRTWENKIWHKLPAARRAPDSRSLSSSSAFHTQSAATIYSGNVNSKLPDYWMSRAFVATVNCHFTHSNSQLMKNCFSIVSSSSYSSFPTSCQSFIFAISSSSRWAWEGSSVPSIDNLGSLMSEIKFWVCFLFLAE